MTKGGLRVFVLYSERFGAEIGSRACRALKKRIGKHESFEQSIWNAELLRSPKLRLLAACEAMDADVVFIAMSEGKALEPEVTSWLDLWKKRGRSEKAALVALLQRDSIDSPHVVVMELHHFACVARMDFFCLSKLNTRVALGEAIEEIC